jgi:DNA-binding NarL/FixJ family response regulator
MSAIRVGILSDTRLFTDGVARIISAEPALELVEIRDLESLIGPSPLCPLHILLLDGRQDQVPALCKRLLATADLKIIVLGVPDVGPLAIDALIAGASGILYQSARTGEVVQAIGQVQQGTVWAPRHVVAAAWKKHIAQAAGGQNIAGWQRLSAREREVLRHAAAGFANKELADRLAISEATVKVHLTHIFQKVGCRNRAELAAAYHGIGPADVDRPGGIPDRRTTIR